MHQDNDADDILEKDDNEEEFKCPHCYKICTKKRSLDRHVSNACKALKGQDFTLPPCRRVLPVPVPVATELRVDKELDGLLANVTSEYTRWRLAQVLGVTQQNTYPILYNYHFPCSRSSFLSLSCPTSDPQNVMVNVLMDAKINFDIEQVSIPKHVVVIGPHGSKIDATKWIKPVCSGQERSDRPNIIVEENEVNYTLSLARPCLKEFGVEELQESVHKMSIDN